jgi:hypothetical protein
VLAIRAEITCDVLKDTIVQFPSYSEALGAALRKVADSRDIEADGSRCLIYICTRLPMEVSRTVSIAALRASRVMSECRTLAYSSA